jgi:hypothetical protein
MTARGFYDATTDFNQIEAWWTKTPNANVAVWTGIQSRIYAVDVDPYEDTAKRQHVLSSLPATLTSVTPRGGNHYIYSLESNLPGSTSKLAEKIDTRGDGGYLLLAPSVVDGKQYQWLDDGADIVPLPAFVAEEMAPKPQPTVRTDYVPPAMGRDTSNWGRKALDECASDVANAVDGTRNATLNEEAFRLGQAVAGGHIEEWEARDALRAAAAACGLTDRETERTIDSGFKNGLLTPRGPDDSKKAPAKAFMSHDAPADLQRTWKPFPTSALPQTMREYVAMAAKAKGVDEAFIALPLLSLLASCIGTTRRVVLKNGYDEKSVLWAMVIAESGSGKSPALSAVECLIAARVKEAYKRHQEELKDYAAKLEVYKATGGARRQRTKKEDGDRIRPPGFMAEAAAAFDVNAALDIPPQAPEVPIERRYVIRDVTREAVVPLLRQNPRGLLLMRDELAGWMKSFDAYKAGKGGDGEFWLEMYNGFTTDNDRKTGPLEERHAYVEGAIVSVCGFIQPGKLQRQITADDLEGGLLARFMLARPPECVSYWTEDEMDDALTGRMQSVVDFLLRIQPAHDGKPVDLPITADAKRRWVPFFNLMKSRGVSTDIPAFKSIYPKATGVAARLALVLQLAKAAEGIGDADDAVDGASMEATIAIANWMMEEAERIYLEMGWATKADKQDAKLLHALRSAVTIHHHGATPVHDHGAREMTQNNLVLKVPSNGDRRQLEFHLEDPFRHLRRQFLEVPEAGFRASALGAAERLALG